MHRTNIVGFVITSVVAVAGCQRGPTYETAALAGRVVIDGEPVAKGGVQFMPIEQGQPAFGEVRDGAYAARVPKGRVRVIFSSTRETGRMMQVYSTKVPEVLDVMPESLRHGIEITVTGDDPSRDFVLSSKPGRQSPPR